MKKIVLNIPDDLDVNNNVAAFIFAARLYEQGNASLGKGAEIAGVNKRFFIKNLGSYNVSVFHFSVNDLNNDIGNA